MEVAFRDETFELLCQISDQQVDAAVKRRLKAFRGRPNEEVKDELLGLIDDIVYCAWTSDFELKALYVIWLEIGGSEEELAERNRTLVHNEVNQAKYKWEVQR